MVNEGKSPKACDACRKRKLRCRREVGSCASSNSKCIRCVQTNLLCTYNDERRKRGPKTGSRLREIRALQEASSPQPLLTSPDGGPTASSTESVSPDHRHADSHGEDVMDEWAEDQPNDGSREPGATPFIATPNSNVDQFIFSTMDTGLLPFDSDPSFHAGIDARDEGVGSCASDDRVNLSKQVMLSEIRQLCCAAYQRYPLWHLDTVVKRVEQQDQLTDGDFRSSCLSILLLNESVAFRKNPGHGASRLLRIVQEIEMTRVRTNGGHFADFPSIYASIASLTLFIAHSICDRHNLAFYYLNEAAGLIRLVDVDTLDPIEVPLYRRVEALLFVTEAASKPVYESSMQWYQDSHSSHAPLPAELSDIGINSLDIKAVNLLYVLVCLYNADTADEISRVPFSNPAVPDIIEHGSLGSTSIQAADVDITRQWQLCLRWQRLLSRNWAGVPPHSNPGAAYTLQIMGLTALQCSRSIRPEEYRIVGHGKIASLATAMFDVASNLGILAGCTALIGDLIQTVYSIDYERHFAPELSMVQLCIEEVPRLITFPERDSPSSTEGS